MSHCKYQLNLSCLVKDATLILSSSKNIDIQFQILKYLGRMSVSTRGVTHLLKEGTYHLVMDLLSGYTLSYALEILSNSLQTNRGFSVAALLSSEKNILILKQAFNKILTNCQRQKV